MDTITIVLLVLVAISVAALFFTWQTFQKNGRLSVEMEKQTREHQMFADRFSAEDVKELVETVISDSWSFPDLRP